MMSELGVVVASTVTTAMLVWHGRIAVTRVAERPPDAPVVVALLVLVGSLPLVLRRRSPSAVFAGCAAAVAALALVDGPLGLPVAPAIALASVAAARVPTVGRARTAALVVGGLAVVTVCDAVAISAMPWSELLHTALLWTACWLAGERSRLQREQILELRRDAERERVLAATHERMRIARDLHDAAGHSVNVIAVQAAAARLRHADDPRHLVDVLTTIEEVARETAAEIDGLVGGLRNGEPDSPPAQPVSLRALADLVRQHEETGMSVLVTRSGSPATLAPSVDQAAYRIVQEGLTNASRHGAGRATLALDFGADVLTITIRNRCADRAGSPRRFGHAGGNGLVGARERAAHVGGALSVSADGDSFVLTAVLPAPSDGVR